MDLHHRTQYDSGVLLEDDADADPLVMFERWLVEAMEAGVPEHNAMVLATVDSAGRPRARNVLLRGVEDGALQFFTNRRSRKGRDLAINPAVSLLFSWLQIHRQVIVEGVATEVPDEVSDDYFRTRPRESRIGAWASEQSSVLAGREELEGLVEAFERRFEGGEVPRPPHWGGYSVEPTSWEFWQGRPNRLHDRLRYRRPEPGESAGAAGWVLERLAP